MVVCFHMEISHIVSHQFTAGLYLFSRDKAWVLDSVENGYIVITWIEKLKLRRQKAFPG